MLKIKRIKPIGSQVLVSKSLYGWDDMNESGIILNKKGDLKFYQEVIAVGDDVRFVKPGDVVEINFYKYAQLQDDPNSIKAMETNKMVTLLLNEVEMTNDAGDTVPCILIDQRDVKYILEDYKEVTYNKDTLIDIKKPKKSLILPNTRIKV